MRDGDRTIEEQSLRAAVLAGDERAWQALYDGGFASLYSFVSWRCGGSRDLTEEVVQETWLQAVRGIRKFQPETASFLTWLRGIAHNVIRNQLRRRRTIRDTVTLHDVPSRNGVAERERAERVASTFAELPARYEGVLRAKYVDRQSVAEIAAELEESPKAIESLLTRARQAFREAFEREE
jgi:RNA polymerase sigma-70 factor (ECF subfamily)